MPVDTGSLRRDLHEIARIVGVQGHRVEPETLRRLVERAVRRGEVAPDNPALDFVPDLIIGAAYGRLATEDAEADIAYLVGCMDAFILPVLLRR
ncbi:TetR/AcrR family transcriptional regulator C-terminal ligand-binding domain-containing protein [Streptomyces sp. NPDC096311]|uniref:TetR/AcrR family transcriptional regulator C-terminal ligand-binding domain-containing protein n=1 Tax=Streptomyces sp. NPDC096311 TaxID=3366083 RepID=UPI00380EDA27